MRIGFIGDIHGHTNPFIRMLLRLEEAGVDDVYQVGDLIDRGPDSKGSVRIGRTWTVTARDGSEKAIKVVPGNHENRYLYHRRHWRFPGTGQVPNPNYASVNNDLSNADIAWIESLPYYRNIDMDGFKVLVVHAGVPSHIESFDEDGVKRRDGYFITRTGFIDKDGAPLSPLHVSDVHWADNYDGRHGYVVFGHTTWSEVTYFDHAVGIDCSKQGAVAGIIIDTDDPKKPRIHELYEDHERR